MRAATFAAYSRSCGLFANGCSTRMAVFLSPARRFTRAACNAYSGTLGASVAAAVPAFTTDLDGPLFMSGSMSMLTDR